MGQLTLYRGGLAGAWEKRGFQAGYLVSKLMRQWMEEDKRNEVEPKNYLAAESLVVTAKEIYKKPVQMQSYSGLSIINLSAKSLAFLDNFSREQHSVSSNACSTVSPPTGNSAYVSLTDNLKIAVEFSSPTELIWQFAINEDRVWKGGKEDEWLGLGGSRIYNVMLSRDKGVTFRPFT